MAAKKMSSSNPSQYEIISIDRLPPPDILKQYEEIVPGIAKTMVNLAEHQSKTRMHLEIRKVNGNLAKSFTGLILGFLMGIFGLWGGFYLTFKGYNVLGIILSSSTLVTLVMTFIYGSQSKRNENHKSGELLNKS
jgi:uncharacterized membrane protein